MAENKKSFILYADLVHTLRKMKREDRGDLFLHLLEYVNDNNPVTDNVIVDLAFEPIKQQLKRDLKDWEDKKVKRSEGGKKGMAKRWADKKEKVITKDNSVIKTITPITVNATANVNVNAYATSREQIYECLRRAAPVSFTKEALMLEAEELLNTYGGKKIGNLQALCNKWMTNVQNQVVIKLPVKKSDLPDANIVAAKYQ